MTLRDTIAAKKAPNPTDKHVGSRVRMRRMMLSMSQEKLGAALGLAQATVRVWKKRLELQAHSRFRIRSACGLPVATGRRA